MELHEKCHYRFKKVSLPKAGLAFNLILKKRQNSKKRVIHIAQHPGII
jgi:hypothetical protein